MKKLFALIGLVLMLLGCMTSADLSLSPSPTFQVGEGDLAVVDQFVIGPDALTVEASLELQDAVRLPIEFEVCTDVLHVRSNPFVAEDNVIDWLERGQVVLVHEFSNGWGRLTGLNEERVRWVKLEFLCRL